jgi:hypothetical protein
MTAGLENVPAGNCVAADGITPTLRAIRNNCQISDARHATDYTLCVYLLKMREYFRWENNLPYSAALPSRELTDWLSARESLWKSIEDNPFEPVPVNDRQYNPFDAAFINQHLTGAGYVYSSGIGRNMKPHFFLGTLEERCEHNGYTLYISGKEFARDLTAPPAMSLGNTIFIRRESLRRMLWEKIEEWRWNKPANAMQKAIECYDFSTAPDRALEQMADTEIRSAMLHEIGEVMAGERLGDGWEDMLATIPHSKAEVMVRAVRDHLADALSTLPGLLEDLNPATLHFYMANLTSMRKSLFPELASAYEAWVRTGDSTVLTETVQAGCSHWLELASGILSLYKSTDSDLKREIITLVESNTL